MNWHQKLCASCRWRDGEKCRRGTPQISYIPETRYENGELRSPGGLATDWPDVTLVDWCGDYKMRKDLLLEKMGELKLSSTDRRYCPLEVGEL